MDNKGNLNVKKRIGLVQVNNTLADMNYLPYAVGFLQAYTQRQIPDVDKKFEFMLPIYKRMPIDRAVDQLRDADAVFFSTYVWNFNISREIARKLKESDPNKIIVFGGCHVPERKTKDYPNGTEDFLRAYPYIDIASTGEGEIPFKLILEDYLNGFRRRDVPRNERTMEDFLRDRVLNEFEVSKRDSEVKKAMQGYRDKNWGDISGLYYLDENGRYVSIPVAKKIPDLNEIPSPFLEGTFQPLIDSNPEEKWISLWETNRGCPFKCSFCDWGTGSKKRMADYDMKRIFSEIDWFSEHKIPWVYCCDANFGIFPHRDLPIAQKMAGNKSKYGFPVSLSVQNTKNSTDVIYDIQKTLNDSGLSRGVLLAFQSLDEKVLEAVERNNIKISVFHDLQKRFNDAKIETFSDIILGLPIETYETFTQGVCNLIENGQHNRIQFNNFAVLPNAPAGHPDYQRKYGLDIVKTKIINMHGSLGEWTGGIYEDQDLVVATNAMPREEWVRTRAWAYMTSLLHFDKLLQLPFVIANAHYHVPFRDIMESFTNVDETKQPILSEINEFFRDKARRIQQGDTEYCHSEKWLDIFWYPDELVYIDLLTNPNKLQQFYQESEGVLERLLRGNGEEVVQESISLNRNLLKVPVAGSDLTVEYQFDVWNLYRTGLTQDFKEIKEGKFRFFIDRTSETWGSLDDWCKKVVCLQNKRGTYLYDCRPLEDRS